MAEEQTPATIAPDLVAEIVKSYLSHHSVAVGELPDLIASVHRALGELGKVPATEEPRKPAVPVRRSVEREQVVCLECGYRGQMLRRHLMTSHGLTPEEYRARWNLPHDHPIIAPAYAERRAALARQIGLGRRRGEALRGPRRGRSSAEG
jgi:predicted transcriptional regulator